MGHEKKEEPKVQQPLNLEPKKSGTNLTVRPVPVMWGTHRRGGTWLDGFYNFRTKAITQKFKTGKSSSTTETVGYEYYANLVQAMGFGDLHKIHKVIKSDAVIWDAGYTVNNEAYISLNIGESESMKLYTGRQVAGTVRGGGLRDGALPDGHPTYKHLIFWVFDDLLFGTNETPPNYELIVEVVHKVLVLDPANTSGDAENDDVDFHRMDGGQLIPEIIISAWTNPLFGGRLSFDDFDLPSWIDACNTLRDEGLGYSFELDSPQISDNIVKEMLNICNGDIIYENGKLRFKLNRYTDDVKVIPANAFLKDPAITPASWYDNGIVNEVRVPYSTLNRNLEPLPAYANDDSSRVKAGVKSKSFSYNGFRSEESAVKIATRYARALSVPSVKYELELDRTQEHLTKGDLITPVFPSFGLNGTRFLRVKDITYPAPGRGGLKVTAEVDRTGVYNAETGAFDEEVILVDPIPKEISGRLAYLTSSQKGSYSDGFLMPMSRESNSDDRALVSFGWDGVSYDIISSSKVFPLEVTVHEWRDFGGGRVNVEISFEHTHEEDELLEAITDTLPDWHLVTVVHNGTSESLNTVWSVIQAGTALQVLGGGRYIISLESGQFGSSSYNYPSSRPTLKGYLGSSEGFLAFKSNQINFERNEPNAPGDTELVRRFAIQSETRGNQQDFADAFLMAYDRDLPQLLPTWGGGTTHAFDYGIIVSGDNGIAPLTTQIEINGSENANYSIDWGDGSAAATGTNATMPQILTHDYLVAGSYTATVSVSPTSGGATQTFSVPVTVDP